jgi:phosphohistidine phosphatase
MRHGRAVDKSGMLYEDKDRPLTEEGIKGILREARGLKRLEGGFDLILHSPLKRAAQTAALVAGTMGLEKITQECQELLPKTSFNRLAAALEKIKGKSSILLVGHEPDLSMTVALLVGCKGPCVMLKKGAVCRVEAEPPYTSGNASLAWLMQPRALRIIGGK